MVELEHSWVTLPPFAEALGLRYDTIGRRQQQRTARLDRSTTDLHGGSNEPVTTLFTPFYQRQSGSLGLLLRSNDLFSSLNITLLTTSATNQESHTRSTRTFTINYTTLISSAAAAAAASYHPHPAIFFRRLSSPHHHCLPRRRGHVVRFASTAHLEQQLPPRTAP